MRYSFLARISVNQAQNCIHYFLVQWHGRLWLNVWSLSPVAVPQEIALPLVRLGENNTQASLHTLWCASTFTARTARHEDTGGATGDRAARLRILTRAQDSAYS